MAKTTAPASLRVVGWLALLWNLVGVAMFFLQTSLTAEQVAAMPPDRQLVYEAMPDWLTVAYAVAVFGGVIGAVGLLLRRRWAVWAFAASLLAVVLQMGGVYAFTPAWEVSGAAGLPMAVLLVGSLRSCSGTRAGPGSAAGSAKLAPGPLMRVSPCPPFPPNPSRPTPARPTRSAAASCR